MKPSLNRIVHSNIYKGERNEIIEKSVIPGLVFHDVTIVNKNQKTREKREKWLNALKLFKISEKKRKIIGRWRKSRKKKSENKLNKGLTLPLPPTLPHKMDFSTKERRAWAGTQKCKDLMDIGIDNKKLASILFRRTKCRSFASKPIESGFKRHVKRSTDPSVGLDILSQGRIKQLVKKGGNIKGKTIC